MRDDFDREIEPWRDSLLTGYEDAWPEQAPSRRIGAAPETDAPAADLAANEQGADSLRVFDEVLERGASGAVRVRLGALIVVTLVIAAVAVLAAVLRPGGEHVPPDAMTTAPVDVVEQSTVPSAATTGAPSDDSGHVTVHIVGAVASPGVVRLPASARVADAVAACGGLSPDADTTRINLARPLVDGEHIHVLRIGEEAAPELPGEAVVGGGSPVGEAGAPGATASALINLNTASQSELETLPRVGPTLAGRIITEREKRGGFTSVEELREVSGIGDATFEQIAPLVTV